MATRDTDIFPDLYGDSYGGSSVDATHFSFFPRPLLEEQSRCSYSFFFFLRFVSLRLVTNLSKRDNAYRVYNYLTKRGTKKKERKKEKREKKICRCRKSGWIMRAGRRYETLVTKTNNVISRPCLPLDFFVCQFNAISRPIFSPITTTNRIRDLKSQVHDTVSVYKERFINETGLFRETHEQTAISRFIEK